jgi:hypothetical protein
VAAAEGLPERHGGCACRRCAQAAVSLSAVLCFEALPGCRMCRIACRLGAAVELYEIVCCLTESA